MIHLDLDKNEKEALSSALKSYLSDLSHETADTVKKSLRDALGGQRELLQRAENS